MLEDFVLSLLLFGFYATSIYSCIWLLRKIPFVRISVRRFRRFFDRVNDKLDEEFGYYEEWR